MKMKLETQQLNYKTQRKDLEAEWTKPKIDYQYS